MFNRWTLKTVIAGTVLWVLCSLFGTGSVDAEDRQVLPAVEQEAAQRYPGLDLDTEEPFSERRDAPDLMKTGLKMSASLIVMIGVLLAGSYGIRRMMNRGKTFLGKEAMIKVLSTRYLGSKQTLSVIDVQGERFAIGVSPQGISFLTRLEGETGNETESKGPSFQKVLKERLHEKS